MKDIPDETKPCLVQTAQGFTVSYKEKLLYSKYAPSKAINQYIQQLQILPQTVILCVSPVLSYGLNELLQKLPQDCIMLACEFDDNLYDFMLAQENQVKSEKLSFLTKDELLNLGPLLTKNNVTLKSGFTLPPCGTFRRIIKIDFSAGAQLNAQLYDKVMENSVNAIMTWWANRVTLVKFGRRYSTNFFKNLAYCAKTGRTVPVQKYLGTIDKPIFVFGAGESVAQGIAALKDNCFIVCADTALQPLVAQNIVPDAVFIEEAQNVISKCFIGMQNVNTHIFAGLSSLHAITRYFKPEQISFFTTEFTQASFIDRFEKQGILPPRNEPFGSVGITAYYYAMLFRKNDSIPVYTYGLDFSYSAGRTHTKGAMADNARFLNSSRIKPDANFAAAFNEPAFRKNEKMFTTPIMARYEQIMANLDYEIDCRVKPDNDNTVKSYNDNTVKPDKIAQILQEEAASLEQLKSLLTGETKLPADQLEKEITNLIQEREYLYLHFPDGHKFVYNQSFLNRVRIEIDYYLKILNQ